MRLIDGEYLYNKFIANKCPDPIVLKMVEDEPTVSAILIPENATNGDMFLKTHPEVVATIIKKKGYLFNCVQLRNKEETIPFAEVYIDWWNAPYNPPKQNLAPADKSGLEYADQPTLQSAT